MSAKKVLVTGAAGFLGRYVLEELVEKGYDVRATDLPSSDFSHAGKLGVEVVPSNLLDPDSLKKASNGVDVVIHLAGVFRFGADRNLLYNVNYRGTENACRAALQVGVERFIHFSTAAVYGKPEKIPVTEDDCSCPDDVYGRSKWWGEKIAHKYEKEHGLPLITLRPTVVYGPWDRYVAGMLFGGGMIARHHRIRKMRIFSGGLHVHWVHAKDVAGAAVFVLEAENALGKAFNIADDSPLRTSEMVRMMLEIHGIEVIETINYYPAVAEPILWFLARTPDFLERWLNRQVQKVWDRIVCRYDLFPELVPSINRELMLFFSRDIMLSNERIKSLGYELNYPDFRRGFYETLEWYRQVRWLPTASQLD